METPSVEVLWTKLCLWEKCVKFSQYHRHLFQILFRRELLQYWLWDDLSLPSSHHTWRFIWHTVTYCPSPNLIVTSGAVKYSELFPPSYFLDPGIGPIGRKYFFLSDTGLMGWLRCLVRPSVSFFFCWDLIDEILVCKDVEFMQPLLAYVE